MSQSKVSVSGGDEAATLELPRPLSQAWKPGTELSLTAFSPEALVALRSRERHTGFIAASLSSLTIEELFGYVLSGVRSGKLVVVHGASRKSVHFRDGQVVFATSTDAWERLGSALVRMKLVSREDLSAALEKVGPGARLGQVLTRTGKLTQAKLYSGMTALVREIVLNLFCQSEGHALFMEGAPPPEDALKLPVATRDLALLGMMRGEEIQRLRRKLPADLRVAQGTAPADGAARALWQKAGQGATVGELRGAYEGAEHSFLTLVDQLLTRKALVVAPTPQAAAEPTSAALDDRPVAERYNAVVRSIATALRNAGLELTDMRSFLEDPLPGMEQALAGVTLSDDGTLDTQRVLDNLGSSAEARARAYEVIDAFVSYALFSARNVLPAEVADRLSREARRLQDGTA